MGLNESPLMGKRNLICIETVSVKASHHKHGVWTLRRVITNNQQNLLPIAFQVLVQSFFSRRSQYTLGLGAGQAVAFGREEEGGELGNVALAFQNCIHGASFNSPTISLGASCHSSLVLGGSRSHLPPNEWLSSTASYALPQLCRIRCCNPKSSELKFGTEHAGDLIANRALLGRRVSYYPPTLCLLEAL